jgi:hypothetical protein
MPNDVELQARRDGLEKELIAQIDRESRRATQTHWIAIVLMVGALACGAIAGVGGLTEMLSKTALGVLALIPAGIAIAVSQFKPQGRSSWHYRKSNEFAALRSRLIYQLPPDFSADQIAAIAKARDDLIKRMQDEWDKEFQFNWTAFHSTPRDRH